MTTIDVCVLDMAGTTVLDGGLVETAFLEAIASAGVGRDDDRLPGMLAYVRDTMGRSKIDVFTHLLGDRDAAQHANAAFEAAYAVRVGDGQCRPVPGAPEAIGEIRAAGAAVALTTGFSPVTQKMILESLGWTDLVDLVLAPADVGRGRPYPDLPLTALLRLGGRSVGTLAVVGDTTADIASGLAAGAGIVAGVLTGAHDEEALRAAGATHVLPSVRELPALLASYRTASVDTSTQVVQT